MNGLRSQLEHREMELDESDDELAKTIEELEEIENKLEEAEKELKEWEGCNPENPHEYDLSSWLPNIPQIHYEDVLETIDEIAFKIGAVRALNFLKNAEQSLPKR
jgi:septal ring factor EnvC (AmiA/AmiB activator)